MLIRILLEYLEHSSREINFFSIILFNIFHLQFINKKFLFKEGREVRIYDFNIRILNSFI